MKLNAGRAKSQALSAKAEEPGAESARQSVRHFAPGALRFAPCAESGSVLFAALVIIGVVCIMLASYLNLINHQSRAVARSQAWHLCVAVGEAGLDDAMAHLQFTRGTNLESSGWRLSARRDAFTRQRPLGGSHYYIASISTSSPPIVEARGFVAMPGDDLDVSRRFRLTTKTQAGMRGLVAQSRVSIKDESQADSYDSTKASHSTGGVYDPAKARDNTFIGNITTMSEQMEITSNTKIYGSIGSGDQDVLKLVHPASVGSASWVNGSHPGRVEGGRYIWDMTETFPSVSVPFSGGASGLAAGSYGGTNYNYLLGSGNYQVNGTLGLDGSKKMMVTGEATLYVTDTFDIRDNAQVLIAPGGKLNLYVQKQFYASGNAKINSGGTPSQFAYFGLPQNLQVYLSGSANVAGTFYAPQAKMDLTGDSVLCGAGACQEIVMGGKFKFHYDESLGSKDGIPFQITSWIEL